jgi:hypothetical protein
VSAQLCDACALGNAPGASSRELLKQGHQRAMLPRSKPRWCPACWRARIRWVQGQRKQLRALAGEEAAR